MFVFIIFILWISFFIFLKYYKWRHKCILNFKILQNYLHAPNRSNRSCSKRNNKAKVLISAPKGTLGIFTIRKKHALNYHFIPIIYAHNALDWFLAGIIIMEVRCKEKDPAIFLTCMRVEDNINGASSKEGLSLFYFIMATWNLVVSGH